MSRTLLVALLVLAPAMAGCLDAVKDVFDPFFAPDVVVTATPLDDLAVDGWNTDGAFQAKVTGDQAHALTLEWERRLEDGSKDPSSTGPVVLTVPPEDAVQDVEAGTWTTTISTVLDDGVWTLRLLVDDHEWKEWKVLRIDATPPAVSGLQTVLDAEDGEVTIGAGVTTDAATVDVYSPDGGLLGHALPVTLTGLATGLYAYQIVFHDGHGNDLTATVQVRAGGAKALPDGTHTFGVVSRTTNQVALWDLTRAGDYLSIADAGAAQPAYLGKGFGVTPDDPVVQDVVADVVEPGMDTMQAAIALYHWMFDALEYDEERLESDTLMLPRDVIQDTENPDDVDLDEDGLVDSGAGNGVQGGVCRSLAATYVSLLRGAGIPARLVTGYLAGNVNGFHAWAEFYAGTPDGLDQSPWVPVDVSGIDGTWDEPSDPDDADSTPLGPAVLLQSFGIRLPHYLPLRPVPPASEVEGWSSAIGTLYNYHGQAPQIRFSKNLTVEFEDKGVLCIHTTDLVRDVANRAGDCDAGRHDRVLGWDGQRATFIVRSGQIIDYGIDVLQAGPGTSIQVSVALPFDDEFPDVAIEHHVYGHSFRTEDGKAEATLTY